MHPLISWLCLVRLCFNLFIPAEGDKINNYHFPLLKKDTVLVRDVLFSRRKETAFQSAGHILACKQALLSCVIPILLLPKGDWEGPGDE